MIRSKRFKKGDIVSAVGTSSNAKYIVNGYAKSNKFYYRVEVTTLGGESVRTFAETSLSLVHPAAPAKETGPSFASFPVQTGDLIRITKEVSDCTQVTTGVVGRIKSYTDNTVVYYGTEGGYLGVKNTSHSRVEILERPEAKELPTTPGSVILVAETSDEVFREPVAMYLSADLWAAQFLVVSGYQEIYYDPSDIKEWSPAEIIKTPEGEN